MTLDIISKILCILERTAVNIFLTYLVIQWVKDIYKENEKVKQKDINHIKKQAYVEFANKLKNESSIEWDYYEGAETIDVEEIDKTLIELIRGIK